MDKKKKIIIGIVIALIVLAIAGVVIYYFTFPDYSKVKENFAKAQNYSMNLSLEMKGTMEGEGVEIKSDIDSKIDLTKKISKNSFKATVPNFSYNFNFITTYEDGGYKIYSENSEEESQDVMPSIYYLDLQNYITGFTSLKRIMSSDVFKYADYETTISPKDVKNIFKTYQKYFGIEDNMIVGEEDYKVIVSIDHAGYLHSLLIDMGNTLNVGEDLELDGLKLLITFDGYNSTKVEL